MIKLASNGLKKQILSFQEKAYTGCISVTKQKDGKRTYGLLQFRQGKLTAAKYGSLKGQDAVEAIRTVTAPILSFANGQLIEDDDDPITLEAAKLGNKAGQAAA